MIFEEEWDRRSSSRRINIMLWPQELPLELPWCYSCRYQRYRLITPAKCKSYLMCFECGDKPVDEQKPKIAKIKAIEKRCLNL